MTERQAAERRLRERVALLKPERKSLLVKREDVQHLLDALEDARQHRIVLVEPRIVLVEPEKALNVSRDTVLDE